MADISALHRYIFISLKTLRISYSFQSIRKQPRPSILVCFQKIIDDLVDVSGCKLTSPGIESLAVNDERSVAGEEGFEGEVMSKCADPVEVV